MKMIAFRYLILLCFVMLHQAMFRLNPAMAQRTPISTPWAAEVSADTPLREYPRPQLKRGQWMNLNGRWDYTITSGKGDGPIEAGAIPRSFEGKILVPFPVESSLSGVEKTVGPDSLLWYRRSFTLSRQMRQAGRVLLHFGAVDWKAAVWINGRLAGTHEGGYDPFSFDITDLLKSSGEQELVVRVWDPTDAGPQARGKQVREPRGIWYTPVTGIWQTVWLEAVPATYVQKIHQEPDIDQGLLSVQVSVEGARNGDLVEVSAWDQGKKLSSIIVSPGVKAALPVPGATLWSPASPRLYDLKVQIRRGNRTIDEVDSYFAMRKISLARDEKGIWRMLLNNAFLFQYGPLDQGWWPDGLYTAPSDEALRFDVVKTREMGFNMIRKHVKVEPARWYYHCDREGLLVWQDMPSGDLGNKWNNKPAYYGLGTERARSAESERIFRMEWNAILETLQPFPCIVVWTPFNEAWGQFKTANIVQMTKEKDPSRLVNTASGGNFFPVGDMIDIHNYPDPAMPHPDLFGKERALVLGEFGGLGLPVPGHVWQERDNWGYQSFKSADSLQKRYAEFVGRLPEMIRQGLSAAVYTQTTDVEIEINGLMTYDRKRVKIPETVLHRLHQPLYDPRLVKMP